MPHRRPRRLALPLVLLCVAALAAIVMWRLRTDVSRSSQQVRRAPVAVADVEHGPIVLRRTFSGALEASASFVVASKVGGRLESMPVDIGDAVRRGELVAQLDDAEYEQAAQQAAADLAVARANLAEARSLAEVARREVGRFDELRGSGFTSQSQFEEADAQRLAAEARVQVAEAQITRAEAMLAAARIRLGYTQVRAEWEGPGTERRVAERFLDAGDTVSANAPLLRIVNLDPVNAVIFVTERDYASLRLGQRAVLMTDAVPGERFQGEIARMAPVFREATRQARVEVRVDNADERLRPGMFVRAELVLDEVEQAVIVPESALTRRGEADGVFVVAGNGDATTARWLPVTPGIRERGRVQLVGADLDGRVITLGQQLVGDGSPVVIRDAARVAVTP